jgi:hypothetical protein
VHKIVEIVHTQCIRARVIFFYVLRLEMWTKKFHGRCELSEVFLEESNISKKPYQRANTKEYYRCKNMKKYSCEFKLRTTKSDDKELSKDGSYFITIETFGDHNHDESTAQSQGPPGLHYNVRKVLESATEFELNSKIRKRKIDDVLSEIGETISPKVQRQIQNHLQYRNRLDMKRSISVAELEMFCNERKESTGLHNAFIPEYNSNSNKNELFVPITTQHMLENAAKGPILAIDATYSVITDGYPLIIAGVLDSNGRFHHVGLAIIQSDEKEAAYIAFFKFLRAQLPDWEPEAILADGALSISNAIAAIFPNCKRLMCHFHVSQKIEKHSIKKIGEGAQIVKQQYLDLQLADSPEIFKVASELFLCDLVSNGHAEFAAYFSKQWLETLPNWFEGAFIGYPSTNNANESANGKFKSKSRKLTLGAFLQELVLKTQDASRNSGMHGFATTPELNLAVQTAGFQYIHMVDVTDSVTTDFESVSLSGRILIKKIYYVRASSNQGMSLSNYKEQRKNPSLLKSFEEYNIWRKSFYTVQKVGSLNSFTCTCYNGLKQKICKHIIAIRLLFEDGFDVRAQAKTVPVGETRPPGRPKGT